MIQIWKCPLKQPFLSSVEVILSSPISLLRTLLTGALVFVAKPEPISLPLTGGYVSLSLDGQAINFSLDTGGARSLVLFGPWFEWIHGYGSCQRSFFGCYFCPRDNPCDDIFSRRMWTVLYGGIESYSYVEHSVTLGIGNHEVRDVKFGLIVDYKGGYGQFPMPILGLSLGRANVPETLLEQLQRQQVIDSLSYSIYASALGDGITGILTLEDSVPTSVAYIGFSGKSNRHSDGKIAASLSPLALFDFRGKELTRRCDNANTEPAIVDTGASSLFIPPEDFENIIDVTWKTLKRERASFNITRRKRTHVRECVDQDAEKRCCSLSAYPRLYNR
ncbi:hypothetical protein FOZ60_012664 [Perkinsus olseni]|uniref:Uncharacterized protein n=1 Tax=Perkinsus olseni TaxID=32597 RepID=A0A7J6PBL5_PEROL|nr:hypothetical protein FOZ60_012664 [Perkinsus olseni]